MKKFVILAAALACVCSFASVNARAGELVVKGFSLGMPAAKALELVNTNHFKTLGAPRMSFSTSNEFAAFLKSSNAKVAEEKTGRQGGESRDVTLDRHYAERDTIRGTWFTIQLRGNKVWKMEFTRDAVDRLFRSNDLDAPEFAAMFAEAYKLPELKAHPPKGLAGEKYWSLKSLDGWHVMVTENKTLPIATIPKASERGFD